MVSLTLSVPEKLKERMDEHEEIKWSAVVRAIIEQQLDDLEEAERIASKSRLTQKDADELAAKVDKGMAEWWEEMKREARHGR